MNLSTPMTEMVFKCHDCGKEHKVGFTIRSLEEGEHDCELVQRKDERGMTLPGLKCKICGIEAG